MNDLQYIFNLICSRRGVNLSNVESVDFNTRINFGLATGTELLPTVANTFYFWKTFQFVTLTAPTGECYLELSSNSGQGSVGVVYLRHGSVPGNQVYYEVDTNSLTYRVNTLTAGTFALYGSVFKITYV